MKKIAIILGNYKHYAEKYLAECMKSINEQNYAGEVKIFIYDNETSDNTFNFIKNFIPENQIIRNGKNDGFAKGNNDCIKKAIEQNFDYVVCLNLDAFMEPDCLSKLIEAAESDEKIGAVQARLMLGQDKEKINSLGNTTHFLGFGYCVGYQENYKDKKLKNIFEIGYFSGAAVLLKLSVLEEIGLFDEEFWMYNEDQDLGWRIWLSGHKCVLASNAVAYHYYEFSRSTANFYWLDRNRVLSILKNYHILTLIIIFPAFLVMEFGLLLFAWKGGWLKEKIKVWKYFWEDESWKYIIKARKGSQKLRKVKDREIARLIAGTIYYQEIDDVKLRIINPVFNLYWTAVRAMMFW